MYRNFLQAIMCRLAHFGGEDMFVTWKRKQDLPYKNVYQKTTQNKGQERESACTATVSCINTRHECVGSFLCMHLCVWVPRSLEIQMWNAEWNAYKTHWSPPISLSLAAEWKKCFITSSNMNCTLLDHIWNSRLQLMHPQILWVTSSVCILSPSWWR